MAICNLVLLLALATACLASDYLTENVKQLVFLNYYNIQGQPPQPLSNVPFSLVGRFVLPTGRYIPMDRFSKIFRLPRVPNRLFTIFLNRYMRSIRQCRHKLHTHSLSAKASRDHARIALLAHVENVEQITDAIHEDPQLLQYRHLLMLNVFYALCPVYTLPPDHSRFHHSAMPYSFAHQLANYVAIKPLPGVGKSDTMGNMVNAVNVLHALPDDCLILIALQLGPFIPSFRLVCKYFNNLVSRVELIPALFWKVYQYRSSESRYAALIRHFTAIKANSNPQARKSDCLSLLRSPLLGTIMFLDVILCESAHDSTDYLEKWDVRAQVLELVDDRQSGFWAEIMRRHYIYNMQAPGNSPYLALLYQYAIYKGHPNIPRTFDHVDDWKAFTGFQTPNSTSEH